ncbi:MAG: hypothetical protein WBR18_09180 [Anaerolineales bacterium]
MIDPWASYQIKRMELERDAEHYRVLSIAQATRPVGQSRISRAMLSFGRGLEFAGKRLQARYAGLATDRRPLQGPAAISTCPQAQAEPGQ